MPKKHYRTIWISDIHLGTRGCKDKFLLSFLKKHSCDTLYLVGDIIDGWRIKSKFYWPQEHSDILQQILKFSKKGTKVVYIPGNHDEFLRPWLKGHEFKFGNISIEEEAVHTTVDGMKLLVIHGDKFDGISQYHRWLAYLGDNAYVLLLMINNYLNFIRIKMGFPYWSLSKFLKDKTKSAVNFVFNFENTIIWECKRRGFDGVVCGHVHTPSLKIIDGAVYANDADWVESCCFLAEEEDGSLVLTYWGEGNGDSKLLYRLDYQEKKVVSFLQK